MNAVLSRGLRAFTSEALALARQATLLHRDVAPVVPDAARGDVVVFVHGFLATAGVFRPLRDAVELGTGAMTASFTHAPGVGIRDIAARLAELVRGFSSPELRVHLVGHSIGGVAVRWFVSELGGDSRVVGTVSIASPFAGAPRARLFPGNLAREIEPGSALLARLRGTRPDVTHLSIAGGGDRVVPDGALFDHGERLVVEHAGHNEVLYHPDAVAAVVRRIGAASAGRTAGPRAA